ncbi:phage holin family protein [Paracoccus sp. 1_MG-2023]|uniref:phage holin family protein n=1 Tax=unclassified Paracoccus (in: a-proteobacteria) TaxID=2688777 RepID=UPI001C091BA7|nr:MULTISPECIES: phage holin family protein [unclassified Paracoccus (in: a-proteobacteria)]MBU2958363.1 phage holin family protein [Paracoccus sp. C2R09]MDO6670282.1 phage holin family protein [Paracoccus sp. 1_MG-2023]
MSDERKAGTGNLIAELMDHVSTLLRKEVDLARTEMGEKLNSALGGIISMAVALVFAIVALNTFSAALVGWIAQATGLGAGWSSLIVTIVFGIIAVALIIRGKNALQARNLVPSKTTQSLRRDVESVKEAYK